MKQLFSIGPFDIYFFGVMVAIAALTSIFLFLHEAKKKNLNHEVLIDASIYALFGIFVGARLIYVLFYNPVYFLQNPVEIIYIHHGGLSVHGGIIGGFLTAYFFSKKNKLPLIKILDTIAPTLALGLAIGRIGCDVFGAPMASSLPWGVEKEGVLYHPAQIYEAVLNYSLFAFLWLKRKTPYYSGQLFLYFLLGYSINRAIVEFSRTNPEIIGPITTSHVLSGIGIAFAVYFMMKLKKHQPQTTKSYLSSNNQISEVRKYPIVLITFLLIVISSILFYYVHI